MRIQIVEYEPVASRMLKKILKEILVEKKSSIKVQSTLVSSQFNIWEYEIDLLFLDLDLRGEDGFELLKSATAGVFHTIVVSGYAERAIEAFEYGVIDFVSKPYDEERIKKALERYRSGISKKSLKYLSIAKENRVSLLPVEDIKYFEAHGRNVKIIHSDGMHDYYNKILQDLEKILLRDFIRMYKSYIIKLSEIKELYTLPGRKYIVKLNNSDFVPVSRNIFPFLKKKFLHH